MVYKATLPVLMIVACLVGCGKAPVAKLSWSLDRSFDLAIREGDFADVLSATESLAVTDFKMTLCKGHYEVPSQAGMPVCFALEEDAVVESSVVLLNFSPKSSKGRFGLDITEADVSLDNEIKVTVGDRLTIPISKMSFKAPKGEDGEDQAGEDQARVEAELRVKRLLASLLASAMADPVRSSKQADIEILKTLSASELKLTL